MRSQMLIYTRKNGKNMDRFQTYLEKTSTLMPQYGGRIIARQENPTIIEGDWPWQSVLVTEWPSREAALAYWNSAEYNDARQYREGVGDYQIVLVDCAD